MVSSSARPEQQPVSGAASRPIGSVVTFALCCLAVSGVVLASQPLLGVSASLRHQPRTEPTDDFSTAEPDETLSGGAGTYMRKPNRNAFSQPANNASFAQRAEFNIGNALFRRSWVSAPASTTSVDGLGPLYNARACQHCHLKDGRGHPPEANFPEDNAISLLVRLSVPPRDATQRMLLADGRVASLPDPVYGGQLQDLAIDGQKPEGHLFTTWHDQPVTLGDGAVVTLRRPAYKLVDLAYGPTDPDLMLSVRVAQPMIGLGLLEAVPDADILALADADDADGDGISGRPNRVWSPTLNRMALGRFGWKATEAVINDQNAAAFNGDIGMSSPLVPAPWGDCTEAQTACRRAPHGDVAADGTRQPAEVTADLMQQLLFYTRALAVPARRDANDPTVLRGKSLFYGIGCTSCHNPKFVTGTEASETIYAGQLIWPYTDMLLHDMGDGLADHRPVAAATGREWRTAPLWGIGLTEQVSGHTYFLHDGRARNLTEAILWHGGEARRARDAFAALPAADRKALIRFLESM